MAGEDLAVAARTVARIPSRLYWGWFVSCGGDGWGVVGEGGEDEGILGGGVLREERGCLVGAAALGERW